MLIPLLLESCVLEIPYWLLGMMVEGLALFSQLYHFLFLPLIVSIYYVSV